jgi:hypothetical protein
VFASSPNPASFDFPSTVAMFFGFLATAYALGIGDSRDEVHWKALIGGFIGFGCGLFLYLLSHLLGLD